MLISDSLLVRATADPGESFLDRMIHLVEGAKRQKTPNEMALTVLLAVLTLIFVIVVATMAPVAVYLQAPINTADLIALLVALIPTTIGALLSAIGIAGIDRTFRFNVLAMSGKAVEAAGVTADCFPVSCSRFGREGATGTGTLLIDATVCVHA